MHPTLLALLTGDHLHPLLENLDRDTLEQIADQLQLQVSTQLQTPALILQIRQRFNRLAAQQLLNSAQRAISSYFQS